MDTSEAAGSAKAGPAGVPVLIAGVDIGSTTSKAVLIDDAGTVLAFSIIDTKHDRDQSGEEVLALALEQRRQDATPTSPWWPRPATDADRSSARRKCCPRSSVTRVAPSICTRE